MAHLDRVLKIPRAEFGAHPLHSVCLGLELVGPDLDLGPLLHKEDASPLHQSSDRQKAVYNRICFLFLAAQHMGTVWLSVFLLWNEVHFKECFPFKDIWILYCTFSCQYFVLGLILYLNPDLNWVIHTILRRQPRQVHVTRPKPIPKLIFYDADCEPAQLNKKSMGQPKVHYWAKPMSQPKAYWPDSLSH